MSTYKHGVYTSEKETQMLAPVLGTAGLQVVVGTAPVNTVNNPAAAVNKPILANSYQEAVEAVGFSSDFASYTLCESIAATFNVINTGPIILINVLDPSTHKKAMTGGAIQVNDNVAKITEIGVIDDNNLTVTIGTGQDAVTLVKGTDYETAFNADGTLNLIMISVQAKAATAVNVAGYKIDPTAVDDDDIVGSVNPSTGAETGLEVVRQIFPKFGMTPGILLAPRFSKSAKVAAALQAKTKEINGVFKCVTVIDIDSETENGAKVYTDVRDVKTAQAVSDANAYAVWPFAAIGDTVYSGSSLAAALTAYVDAVNDDTPNVSPSNKTLTISKACLPNGTEVVLDQDQANTVNSFGVATFLNFQGFRLWGNNTAAYPGTTDPKDRWFSVKRFMLWSQNTFILTYFQEVDDPANPRKIEKIVDNENVRGNGFVARGICARYEIVYNEEENTTADLLNGVIRFHQYVSPYVPAEVIEDVFEFDADALAASLSA